MVVQGAENRKGRIFIDFHRNHRGATAVAPYSLRARNNLPASTPLRWEDLENVDAPEDLNYSSLPGLVAAAGDPWAEMDEFARELPAPEGAREGLDAGEVVMAPRASWKGYLKLSLVSCPVRLYPATSSSERVRFNQLHKDTHNRINMKPVDPELGLVERSDLVRGYEYEDKKYIIVEDEDLEAVKIETNHTMAIEAFVDAAEVDVIWQDTPYYLAPDGAMAEETFVVLREAMRGAGKLAIARLVLSSRERMVTIAPRENGMFVCTLRAPNEVRSTAAYFDEIAEGEPDKEMLELAEALIAQKTTKFDPKDYEDRYEGALMAMIKEKLKGHKPIVAADPQRGNVVNLMDALKQSLGQASRPRRARARRRRRRSRRPRPRRRAAGARRRDRSRRHDGRPRRRPRRPAAAAGGARGGGARRAAPARGDAADRGGGHRAVAAGAARRRSDRGRGRGGAGAGAGPPQRERLPAAARRDGRRAGGARRAALAAQSGLGRTICDCWRCSTGSSTTSSRSRSAMRSWRGSMPG